MMPSAEPTPKRRRCSTACERAAGTSAAFQHRPPTDANPRAARHPVRDFEPEDIDLAAVATGLREVFGDAPPLGFLQGRTALRDAVAVQLDCSLLQAEEVVDTMVSGGFLRYRGSSADAFDELGPWQIVATPGGR